MCMILLYNNLGGHPPNALTMLDSKESLIILTQIIIKKPLHVLIRMVCLCAGAPCTCTK